MSTLLIWFTNLFLKGAEVVANKIERNEKAKAEAEADAQATEKFRK